MGSRGREGVRRGFEMKQPFSQPKKRAGEREIPKINGSGRYLLEWREREERGEGGKKEEEKGISSEIGLAGIKMAPI